jgi:hypothetical protein
MTSPHDGAIQATVHQATPGTVPNDGVRSLLAIALGWTVVAALAVVGIGIVRPPVTPDGWTGWGGFGGWEDWEGAPAGIDLEDPAFRILTVNGEPAHRVDKPRYTVRSATAVLEVEVLKDEQVDCWTEEGDDLETVGTGPGTWTVRIDLEQGPNVLGCASDGPIGQLDMFEVVREPDGAGPSPRPTASAASSASGEPDLFEITSIDGRHPNSAAGGSFTVHQPSVRIDIDQHTPATVSCDNADAGWVWETEPQRAAQFLEIDLRPGTNAITCEAGKGPVQRERFEVVFVVDPTPSADPAAVVITTIDGWARNTIPDHGYTTGSRRILMRGSAPDPGEVVCTGAACEGQPVQVTGASTWEVQLELAEGTNRVEVHAAGDPSNSDRITVELVP